VLFYSVIFRNFLSLDGNELNINWRHQKCAMNC